MILKIKNNLREYEVALEGVNQWCGENIIKKNNIINMLCKYFSKSKYMEYDEIASDIFLENEVVGRNYYNVYLVQSREQMISELKLGKNTLMMKYVLDKISINFDVSIELEQVKDILIKIYEILNATAFNEFQNIKLDFENSKLLEIIQQSIITYKDGKDIHYLSNYELVLNYLKLVKGIEMNSGGQALVIMNNIDHLLYDGKYKKIYLEAEKMYATHNIGFVFGISIDGYCVVNKNNINSITIINDQEIILPEYDKIVEFIENNYPINVNVTEDWILSNIKMCIQKIGKENSSIELSSEIILTMINKTLLINSNRRFKTNSIELNFINNN